VEIEKLKKYLAEEVKKVVDCSFHAFVFWHGKYVPREVSEKEMEKILNEKDEEAIRGNLSCFVFQTILDEILKYSRKPVIQLIIGAYLKFFYAHRGNIHQFQMF